MADMETRLIELAEDRLRVAEELRLSVSGLVARIYACVHDGEFDQACEHLDTIDERINEARLREGGGQS